MYLLRNGIEQWHQKRLIRNDHGGITAFAAGHSGISDTFQDGTHMLYLAI